MMSQDEELIERHIADLRQRATARRDMAPAMMNGDGERAQTEEADRMDRLADRLEALAQPEVGAQIAVPFDVWHAVVDAASAHADFVAARESMNAAIPALDATPAERALYDERYKADHEAERKHWSTAIALAQVAEQIVAASTEDSAALAASPSPVVGNEGRRERAISAAYLAIYGDGMDPLEHAEGWDFATTVAVAVLTSEGGQGAESLTRRMMAAQASEAAERGEPYNERDGG